jgi:hypothetical protein
MTGKSMNENINNWVFHFNPYTQKWNGIHRDNYLQYWNDRDAQVSLEGDSIEAIIAQIELYGSGNI